MERARPFEVVDPLYPSQDHWFERSGSALHYLDEGSGQPVLMLHGNPTWSFLYRKVIAELAGSCRSIAPDLPGFGFSDHPPGYGYTPPEHADWIRALVAHLDLSDIVLVVQDWGGPIGLSVATGEPDRFAGLVICNTWAWPPDFRAKAFSVIMGGVLGRYLHRRRNFFARRIVPAGIHRPENKPPEVLKAYTDPFPTPESRKGTWVFPRAIRSSAGWLAELEQRLPRLADQPVEIVWALRDPAFRKPELRRWQQIFPNASVDKVPDASHYLQEECPDRIAEAVRRILARTSGSG